jgi:hypothetical protein
MPGTSLLPGVALYYTLEEILEFSEVLTKLFQFFETPTGEFLSIYEEERSLTSKFMIIVK